MQIYLAGSLFSEADRDYAKKILRRLEIRDTQVYWPWRDTGDAELKRMFRGNMQKVSDEIVRRNLVAIKRSDFVVAIVDGADVEPGTAMEIGYAHALGKKVFGLRTDFRTQGEHIGPMNIMISRSMVKLFSNERDLFSHLKGLRRREIRKGEIGEFYSAISGEYTDTSLHPITNQLRMAEQSFTRGFLSGKTYDTALDLGCGAGGFLEFVAAENKIGIDFSRKMITEHRRKLPNVTFIVADIEKQIPSQVGSADIVHSGFLIDHITNLGRFFSRVNEFMRESGNDFLLSFHNKKLMVNYRKNDKTFTFRSAVGKEYNVFSIIPSYTTIRSAFEGHFYLKHKETISFEYGDGKIGVDYLILGARK